MLLAKLIHIALGGNFDKKTRGSAKTKAVTASFSLAALAKRKLGIELDKSLIVDGKNVRLSYEQYKDNVDAMPLEYFEYNAKDTQATFHLWKVLKKEAEEICTKEHVDPKLLLSHWTEVEKAWAGKLTSILGVGVDLRELEIVQDKVKKAFESAALKLRADYGYFDGNGERLRFQEVMEKVEREFGNVFAKKWNKTQKKNLYSKEAKDLKPFAHVPFVGLYLEYAKLQKLSSTFVDGLKKHIKEGRIHPEIKTCLDTGRVAFSKPNLQQIPRPTKDYDFRRCIIPPKEEALFLGVDNTAAELVALADRCVREFGKSKLADAINEGKDIHKLTAQTVTGKPYEEITKEDRQMAKALNFGFPGGLGAKSFVEYAKASYGVIVTEEEAKKYKEDWLNTYPELRPYLKLSTDQVIQKSILEPICGKTKTQSFFVLKDVLTGKDKNRFETPYKTEEKEWAWANVKKLINLYPHVFGEFKAEILSKNGSEKLAHQLDNLRTATLPSGRIRGKCTYNNFNNNAFQGAQADIAGTGWYQLWRNGFEVAHMVHDEMQILIPDDERKEERRKRAEGILLEAAKQWCPNATMRIESGFSECWEKG